MHFSQFNETPALINPALTGANDIRASINYRKQWKKVSTPFNSYGVSFETRNHARKKKIEEGDFGSKTKEKPKMFYGGGLSIFKDKAGEGALSLTQIGLSGAAFVPTGERSYFSLGMQGAYVRRKVEAGNFVFPNQYADGGYDVSIDSGENPGGIQFGYMDLGAGVQWMYNDEERGLKEHRELKMHFGAAVYHITTPTQKFIRQGLDEVPMKYVAHADVLMSLPKTKAAIMPSVLFQMQGSAMEIVAGALFKYKLNDNFTRYTNYAKQSNVCGGVYYRTSDAVILQGLLEWKEQFAVGLSYDLNISGLRSSSHMRGGTELVLRYMPGYGSYYERLAK